MAELETRPTRAPIRAFLASLDDAKRLDCAVLVKMMRIATGARAVMRGTSIVGFGAYSYTYASGRSGDGFLTGFAHYGPLLAGLGRHRHAKSWLYLRSLVDVDLGVLRARIEQSVRDARASRAEKEREPRWRALPTRS